MRTHGVARSAAGLVPFGHLGWAYRDQAEFRALAGEYLADGIEQGQYVLFAGDGSPEALRGEVSALPGLSGGFPGCEAPAVGVMPVHEFFALDRPGDVMIPARAIEAHVAALNDALARGYTGLRAAIDATAMARTPAQREAATRFEVLADRKMASSPVSALCGFDATELGAAADELVCLHPYIGPGSPLFQLYADPAGHVAVSGELDRSCDELFATTLARAGDLVSGPVLRIDARGLDFVDHRCLLMLGHYAAARGATAVVRGGPPSLHRLLALLDVPNLRAEKTEETGS
jgi:hypothetical protein